MNLSDNLKKIRKEHNLSQEDLAEKLGVSRQSVSKWESNQAYPEMDKMIMLCKMFNLNIDELLNQDINDIKDKEVRKNKFNLQVQSFLDFITKVVNLFSAMRFRDIIKCIFEQIVLFIISLIVFYIFSLIISGVLNTVANIIPFRIRDFIEMVLQICYMCFAIVVLLHIFKIRYLDYYKIVDKEDINREIEEEVIENKHNDKIIYKKEKIIIRDPEKSSIGFFSWLVKLIIIIFKSFVGLFSLSFIFSFIFIVICLVLSFLFIKTGMFFVGCLFLGIGGLLINALIIIVLYNFIFNGNYHWNRYLIVLLISLIMCGIGFGNILVGLKDFNVLDNNNEKYYVNEKINIDLKNDFNIFYYNAHFIETNDDQVRIEFIKPNYSNDKLYLDKENNSIYVNEDGHDFMNGLRFAIDVINDKYMLNDMDSRIIIYANSKNINKIHIKR